jgi:hypothetical protein
MLGGQTSLGSTKMIPFLKYSERTFFLMMEVPLHKNSSLARVYPPGQWSVKPSYPMPFVPSSQNRSETSVTKKTKRDEIEKNNESDPKASNWL